MGKKVAVMGGAFDPPQLGHLDAIIFMCETLQFDEIRVIPCGTRGDKPWMSHKDIRLELTRRMLAHIPEQYIHMVKLDEREVHGESIHSKILMRKMRDQETGCDFFFFGGFDLFAPRYPGNLCQIQYMWDHGKVFYDETNFVVAPRDGYRHPREYGLPPGKFIVLEKTPTAAASSDIRSLIAEGKEWKHLVPEAVATCIETNHWYREKQK